MLVGIDWGGTKLEIIVLEEGGETYLRRRVDTPKHNYDANLQAIIELVRGVEREIGAIEKIGFGIPGTISPKTGLVKNANSTWLNGKPLKEDLEAALACKVRIENDANCFTVSEATDGACSGEEIVVGVIIGTGCGSGIAINGKAWSGRQGIAGEFGHTPLPLMTADERPGNACWCSRRGCLETYISGTGFERDYETRIGFPSAMTAREIIALDDEPAQQTYKAYLNRLARGLSQLINFIDPNSIVLGGGMSNVLRLYDDLPDELAPLIFTDIADLNIVRAKHGDSSGVRGAAWLWRKGT